MTKIGMIDDSQWQSILGAAHTVQLSSYILGSHTQSLLEAAARSGAQVHVILSGIATGAHADQLQQRNQNAIAELQAAGIDATLSSTVLHIKAAVIDDVAYLDDANWRATGDLIVQDRRSHDVARVERMFETATPARGNSSSGLAMAKGTALVGESDLLRESGGSIDVQTETIGPCEATRLLAQLADGHAVRVVVSRAAYENDTAMQREARILQSAGVEIRTSNAVDKYAVVGDRAWIGSANMTSELPKMLDWGLTLSARVSVHAIEARFQNAWNHAQAVPAA
jgi:hypothetical protein